MIHRPRAKGVARIVLKSPDADSLAGFFVAALGFARVEAHATGIDLCLADSRLRIESATGRPYPPDVPGWSPLFQHFAVATPDISASYDRLRLADRWAPISRGGPQRLPVNTGGVTAFKFRDPDGHPLELIEFPGDSGSARIDHSAISVADAGRSIAFYRALGLTPGGRSFNHGPEQDALDGLENAGLDVVALEPPRRAPHVELLAYRAADRVNEIAGPAYTLDVEDVAATRIVFVTSAAFADRRFHDPDGHWLEWEISPAGR